MGIFPVTQGDTYLLDLSRSMIIIVILRQFFSQSRPCESVQKNSQAAAVAVIKAPGEVRMAPVWHQIRVLNPKIGVFPKNPQIIHLFIGFGTII